MKNIITLLLTITFANNLQAKSIELKLNKIKKIEQIKKSRIPPKLHGNLQKKLDQKRTWQIQVFIAPNKEIAVIHQCMKETKRDKFFLYQNEKIKEYEHPDKSYLNFFCLECTECKYTASLDERKTINKLRFDFLAGAEIGVLKMFLEKTKLKLESCHTSSMESDGDILEPCEK